MSSAALPIIRVLRAERIIFPRMGSPFSIDDSVLETPTATIASASLVRPLTRMALPLSVTLPVAREATQSSSVIG